MASPEPQPSSSTFDEAGHAALAATAADSQHTARTSWWRRSRKRSNGVSPGTTPENSPPLSAQPPQEELIPYDLQAATAVTSINSSRSNSSTNTLPPENPPSAWWRRSRANSAPSAHLVTELPSSSGSGDAADDGDIVDVLDALVTPYEYTPVQLSFGCFGSLSADTQVFRLRNVCGRKIEVRDAQGQLVLKGIGIFKPIGYFFDFYESSGRCVFSVGTLELAGEETYELVSPNQVVVANARRKRCTPRTKIRMCAGPAKLDNPVEVECKSLPKKASMGRYQVATPDGNMLGTIHRHFRKGVVTHQNFTIVVGPEVDPYLMVFLALTCNCVNNERSRIGWTLGAAGLVAVLV